MKLICYEITKNVELGHGYDKEILVGRKLRLTAWVLRMPIHPVRQSEMIEGCQVFTGWALSPVNFILIYKFFFVFLKVVMNF